MDNIREVWMNVEKSTAAISCSFEKTTNEKFEAAGAKKENPPQCLYSRFSRVEFLTISEDRKSATMSVNVTQKGEDPSIRHIIRQSKFADKMENYLLCKRLNSSGGSQAVSSPAYTVKIAGGKAKGKTPAQILIEDPAGGSQMLMGQRSFLAQNISNPQYAHYAKNNQAQIDAIDDALRLLQNGQLDRSKGKANVFPIYKTKPHVNPYRERADKKHPCSLMEVTWEFGETRPVVLHIRNFWALMTTDDKGLHQFVSSSISPADVVDNTIRLTQAQWMDAMEMVEANMKAFESHVGASCQADAANAERRNRDAAKQRAAGGSGAAVYSYPQGQQTTQPAYNAYGARGGQSQPYYGGYRQ